MYRVRNKSEVRISKSETNPKYEIQMTQTFMTSVLNFVLGYLNLFRISDFVFRVFGVAAKIALGIGS